jgi:hypothetical protein
MKSVDRNGCEFGDISWTLECELPSSLEPPIALAYLPRAITDQLPAMLRRSGMHRDKLILLSRTSHRPRRPPRGRAESDEPSLIMVGVAGVTHAILAPGQVEVVERASVAEANGRSPVALGEIVEVTLLGAAAVLTEGQDALFLVQQATRIRCECRPPFQSAGDRPSPIDDEAVKLPAADQKGLEVCH